MSEIIERKRPPEGLNTPEGRSEAEARAWEKFDAAIGVEREAEAQLKAAQELVAGCERELEAARRDRSLARSELDQAMYLRNRTDFAEEDEPPFGLCPPLSILSSTRV